MKGLTNLFLCASVVSVTAVHAQTTKVVGKVISADDDAPVIGASVIVEGTTTGTITDFNGAFSLDVRKRLRDDALTRLDKFKGHR